MTPTARDNTLLRTEVGAVPQNYSIGVDVVADGDGLKLVFTQYGHNHLGKVQVVPMAAGGIIPWHTIAQAMAQISSLPVTRRQARDFLREEEVTT